MKVKRIFVCFWSEEENLIQIFEQFKLYLINLIVITADKAICLFFVEIKSFNIQSALFQNPTKILFEFFHGNVQLVMNFYGFICILFDN